MTRVCSIRFASVICTDFLSLYSTKLDAYTKKYTRRYTKIKKNKRETEDFECATRDNLYLIDMKKCER